MSHHDELLSIDASALEGVTGGLINQPKAAASPMAGMAGMPPMSMAAPGGAGGACPCGCGMANCKPR